MPSFTHLALMAEAYATLAVAEVHAVPAEETASRKATQSPPAAELAGNKDGPGQGWYPVDAIYNFGPIRDLFAMRRTF